MKSSSKIRKTTVLLKKFIHMSYSINSATTIAGCNTLIQTATREKSKLEGRLTIYNIQKSSYTEFTAERQAELNNAQLELANITTELAAMPEGPDKTDKFIEKMALELSIAKMQRRISGSSGSDLLEKELDVAKAEAEITVLADFILAVETRKTQLAA
jgi:hypothetical protein